MIARPVRTPSSRLIRSGLGLAVLLVLLAAPVVEVGSYAVAVRTAQARADRTATQLAELVRTRGPAAPFPPQRPFVQEIETLDAGATDPDDQGAVRVTTQSNWSSPLLGVNAAITTSATAGIMPSAGPGGQRIAILR